MHLSELFLRCLQADYTHTERGGDFSIEREGERLYLFFQDSDGEEDWKNNLNFPAKAYPRHGQDVWYVHRGFLSVWRAVMPYLAKDVADPSVREILSVGYSHGAALALLCHEYAWYSRPELRDSILGVGFGCPRVLWGTLTETFAARWANFTVVRNLEDLVTHLPPAFLGYRHVGRLLEIGERGQYSPIEAHRKERILESLLQMENQAP